MPSCLGLYIESNLIKYAKVSKEPKNSQSTKIESYGMKFYDNLSEALEQIINETFSYKDKISVNLSGEMYNYFELFSLLNKKDIDNAIKTEFEILCEDRGFTKNALESKYVLVDDLENKEKIRAMNIAVNKTEIAKKIQDLDGYKLTTISSVPLSIANLVDVAAKENVIIINIEEKTSVTTIINGQIYKVDILEEGMKNIFEEITLKENSYAKAYEICKNTTIYTQSGKELQEEENEHLQDIMPTLYSIVTKSKEIFDQNTVAIDKVYISGTATVINNLDLYFQEYFQSTTCEILKPYFIPLSAVKVNIKDYIEVNSAIALALQGLGEGIKEINFSNASFWDKVSDFMKIEVNSSKVEGASKFKFEFDLGKQLDRIEKNLLRVAGGVFLVVIAYVVVSKVLGGSMNHKQEEVNSVISDSNSQIATINGDINKLKSKTDEYSKAVQTLQDMNEKSNEKYQAKKSIPNLLNQVMFVIPADVQVTSIENTTGKHVVINAQASQYEQLGYFKAKLKADNILLNVKSNSGVKQDSLVKVTIEGDLP